MKKTLLSILALVLSLNIASAVTQVFNVAAGAAWNSTNFFTLSSRINSVTINTGSSGGVTNLTYALIDAPTNNVTLGWGGIMLTNGGYMTVSQYTTNMTKITTNISGFMSTNVFTNALVTYTNYVGQTSNVWRRIAVGTVGSNSTVTITGPFNTIFGLGLTNNNIGVGMTLTVDYDPSL